MPYRKGHIPNFRQVAAPLYAAFHKTLEQVKIFAEREKNAFVSDLRLQAFPSFNITPLSRAWAETKKKLNLDPRTMFATHEYTSKIRVFVQGSLVYIGFDEGDMAVDPHTKQHTKFPLHLLAAVQEYGSEKAHVPPRPHWGVFQRKIERDAVELRRRMMDTLLH